MARLTMAGMMELCTRAYGAASPQDRADSRTRWVMDRPWYDRLRAEAMTEDQELARAQAHAAAWVNAMAPLHKCPACGAGPFDTMDALAAHVAAMADPAYREPDDNDFLFGVRLEVRDHGGEPHLEAPARTPDPPWVQLASRLAELGQD